MQENQKICQSCGMPMDKSDYGTNQDGSVNEEYCKYCYKAGAFASEETMQEMIDSCVPHMVDEAQGYTEAKVRDYLGELLPTLKRWAT